MELKDFVVGIIGNGTVGSALAQVYRGRVGEVRVYDLTPDKGKTHGFGEVLASNLIFICLPTPSKPDGMECDTTILEDFFTSIPYLKYGMKFHTRNFVLKSTVPVGFTQRIASQYGFTNLVHSPSFITERTAVRDTWNPTLNIIGIPNARGFAGGGPITGVPSTHTCCEVLRDFYIITSPGTPIHLTNSNTSEMVKLGMNGFFATKIAYFNELCAFCEGKGIDYEEVRHLIVQEGRVHPLHTQIPGPDGKYGFGGKCLPKDLTSLIWQMYLISNGATKPGFPYITEAAMRRNAIDRERKVEGPEEVK